MVFMAICWWPLFVSKQVSPDLYGDNNTRLFTYWTVSIITSQIKQKKKKLLHTVLKSETIYINHFPMFLFLFSSNACIRHECLKNQSYCLIYFFFNDSQSDAYQATGCYNLLCSGFIQINSEIAMGATIFPVSGYHGSQYDINILIWKVKTYEYISCTKIHKAEEFVPLALFASWLIV